jgi:hypothetical protein
LELDKVNYSVTLKIIIVLLLTFCCTFVYSQEQDVLILNNGKKLKGYILEKDSISYKLLITNDKIIIQADSNVIQIEKQPVGVVLQFSRKRFEPNGFRWQNEITNGYSANYRTSNSFRLLTGYRFNNNYFLGLGLGGTTFREANMLGITNDFNTFPIFLRFSYDFMKNKSSPYVFTDIGSNRDLERNGFLKPFFIRGGIGNKILLKRNTLYFGMGYNYFKTRDYLINPIAGQPKVFGNWYKSYTMEILLGIQFH